MIIEAVATGAFAAAALSLGLIWRQRSERSRQIVQLREEIARSHEEALRQIGCVGERIESLKQTVPVCVEAPGEGRLNMPSRGQALKMLRAGMSADITAVELGMAREEIRLLGNVAALLTPRN
jgi:hypothetical protein